jgi:hypothetical protein
MSQPYSLPSADAPVAMVSTVAQATLLDQKHAYWSKNHDTWDMLDLLYRGGQAIQEQAARFLRKRPKELPEVYTARLVAFDYAGIVGTALGWYQSKLFSKDPTIDIRPKDEQDPSLLADAKKKPYLDFLQNCDRSNTTYVDFWRLVFQNLLVFKGCYVCVDLPRLDDSITNRAAQRAAGGLDPYLTIWDPRSVINWDVDDFGNLLWAVVKVKSFKHTFLGDGLSVDRWYYYDRKEYRIYERSRVEPKDSGETTLFGASGELVSTADQQTAKLIDSGNHSMAGENRVPLRYVTIPEGLWLANRAYLPSMTHLNLENSLIWAVIMANLPVAVIKGDSEFNQTISETAFISLDKDASFEWTEPKGTSFKTSQELLGAKREEIFRSMFLMAQGRDSSAAASSASGVSKELDMTPSKDVLAAFGDVVRAQGQNLLQDIALVRGDTNIDFDVRGFNFEESSAIDEAEVLELLMSLDIQSDEFYKQAQIRVLQSYLTDANRAVIQQCIDEVNAAPTRSEQAAQEAQAQKLAMTAGLQKATARIAGTAQAQDGLANEV